MLYIGTHDHGFKHQLHHNHYHVEDDYNANNNDQLNSQMFGLLSLVLGVIFFCIIWLVACICGGVAGWFTRGQLDGRRKESVEYRRRYDTEKDEENHHHQ